MPSPLGLGTAGSTLCSPEGFCHILCRRIFKAWRLIAVCFQGLHLLFNSSFFHVPFLLFEEQCLHISVCMDAKQFWAQEHRECMDTAWVATAHRCHSPLPCMHKGCINGCLHFRTQLIEMPIAFPNTLTPGCFFSYGNGWFFYAQYPFFNFFSAAKHNLWIPGSSGKSGGRRESHADSKLRDNFIQGEK